MAIHLASRDLYRAWHPGTFRKESDAAVEAADQGWPSSCKPRKQTQAATVIEGVSDHGFIPVDQRVNLRLPFIKGGLMRSKPANGIGSAEDRLLGECFLARRGAQRAYCCGIRGRPGTGKTGQQGDHRFWRAFFPPQRFNA
ncbi:MAG: hypothetical protein ABSA57_15465 [Candidatus Acidiferrales bacterium]